MLQQLLSSLGQRRKKQGRSRPSSYVPFLIGVSLSMGSLFLWGALHRAENAHMQRSLMQKAEALNIEITEQLEPQLLALIRMAKHWEQEGGLRRTDWETEARMNIQDFRGYRAIAWVEPSSRIRWVMPSSPGTSLQSLSLNSNPVIRRALNQARTTGEIALTPYIDWAGGHNEFIVVVPIRGTQQVEGYTVGIFQAQMLFNALLDQSDFQNYAVQISSGGTKLYGRHNDERSHDPSLTHTTTITLYNLNWQVQVAPTQELWMRSQTYLPEVALLSGVGLSWLLALAVYLIQQSDRAIQSSRRVTAQLQDTNQQLETEIQERQQAEQLLQSTQEQLEHLLSSSLTVIYSCKVAGDYATTFVSQNITELFGYTPQDFLQDPQFWISHIHPDDRAQVLSSLPTLLVQGQASYEYRLLHRDGSYRWVSDSLKVVGDAQGTPIEIVGSMQDISDRKQADEQVKQTQKFLQTVVEHVPVALFVKDGRPESFGQFKLWNQTSEQIFGLAAEETIGATDADFFPPEQAAFFHQRDVETFAQGTTMDIPEEAVYSRTSPGSLEPSERILHTIKVPIFDQNHQPDYLLCISQDITEQKRSEVLLKQLLKELTDFKFALDASSIVSITDAEGIIQYVNGQFCQISRYTYGELLGQNHRIIKSSYHPAFFYQQIWSTIIQGKVWKGEICNRAKDGDLYWVDATIVPLLDDTGSPAQYISISIDITEKKLLEKQFLRVQRMESLGTLAGGIAHDLNNILAPIMMAVQLLQQQEQDDYTQQWLEIMQGSAKRGTDLVKQILSFARGSSGERTVLRLSYVIHEIKQILEETFPKAISLHCDVPQGLWSVCGDPTQFHQVFMNLCINARDAMPQGGTLSITAQNVDLDEQYARLHLDAKPGSYVEVTVTDTGVGIPATVLDRIFEPFFTTKEFGKGTGMGLSTAMGIIRSHDGFITVSSTEGQGTEFKVYLPARDQTILDSPVPQVLAYGNGELILVVDDETAVCEMARASLQNRHYQVLTAHSGMEAVSLYTQHREKIQLILLDMMMPEMNGWETMRAIRQLDVRAKFVLMSGLIHNLEQPDDCPGAIVATLSKPFTVDDLVATLNQVTGL